MNKTHGLRRHPLYSIWRNVKTRCYNPKTHNYKNYGGKGISMCNEWLNDFESFYNWSLANGYDPLLTLDRKKSSLGYSPDNCRWTTYEIQSRNKGKYSNGSTIFIGVYPSYLKSGKVNFCSSLRLNNECIYFGSHDTAESAARARDKYIIENKLSGYTLNFDA